MVILFFSLLSGLYFLFLLWLYVHWTRIPTFKPTPSSNTSLPLLTVVIPVRNESATIVALLQDLAQQMSEKEPSLSYEVIVMDDGSTDDTASLVRSFLRTSSYPLRLLSVEVPTAFQGSHKKLALRQAIDQAQGEVIVTTDGDCRVGKYWLSTVSRFFARYQPVLLAAPVTFHRETSIFGSLQTVEFASLIGAGAACLQAGYPTMCNGANLAFSRDAFYRVGGVRRVAAYSFGRR